MNETYLLEVNILYNYLLKHLTSSKPQSAIANWEMNFFPVCATGSQTNYILHKILTSCSSSLKIRKRLQFQYTTMHLSILNL